MSQTRIYLILLASTIFSGCVTSQQAAQTSSYELCYKLALVPGFNVNRGVRVEELKRRGEDCSQYQNQIANQIGIENERRRIEDERRRIEYERQAVEEQKHQRQLELERAKATQIIINQPAPIIQNPSSYYCRQTGRGTSICEPN
jgi:hypothetical protein